MISEEYYLTYLQSMVDILTYNRLCEFSVMCPFIIYEGR